MKMVEPTMSQDKATRLSEIATKYGDSILRTCFLYLNNMTLAEDALQDTLIRVYEKMDSFRQESSEKTWITRIAINISKDYQKSK